MAAAFCHGHFRSIARGRKLDHNYLEHLNIDSNHRHPTTQPGAYLMLSVASILKSSPMALHSLLYMQKFSPTNWEHAYNGYCNAQCSLLWWPQKTMARVTQIRKLNYTQTRRLGTLGPRIGPRQATNFVFQCVLISGAFHHQVHCRI